VIHDIPTSDEFFSAAKAQFDFAWDIAISFFTQLEDAQSYDEEEIEEDKKKAFWEAARQRIITSLTIAQQGIELSIKAKLVSISPFLIIAGSHSDWPKSKGGKGVSFSEFRTVDAHDLVKVYDVVSEKPFDAEFVRLFEKVRKLRNKAMHSVDKSLSVSAQEVIEILLESHKHLFDGSWIDIRREFLENAPDSHVYYENDHVGGVLAREFLIVFKMLDPSRILRLFDVDKKQRLYICPACKVEVDRYGGEEPRYAVLKPKKSKATSLFCFVCNTIHEVKRVDCDYEGCLGDVISTEYSICCTCGCGWEG
jgi:hypothetical protein